MLLLCILLTLSQLLLCYGQSCEGSDWYCENTEQCVASNQTCNGTCYVQFGDYYHSFNYNNDIYYCAITDKCHVAEDPCGAFCHPTKVSVTTIGYQWTFIEKYLCEEDNKCYEGGSDENIACRNTFYNCSSSEHYCEAAGGCQANSETCSDFVEDLIDTSYYSYTETKCLAKDHAYCDLSSACQPKQDACTDGCEEGFWYCKTTQACLPVNQSCGGLCVNYSYAQILLSMRTLNDYQRYLCQDDGECKKYSKLCGERCYPRPGSSKYNFCTETERCQPHTKDCSDGCTNDQTYCRETGRCNELSEPCYGECFFQEVSWDPRQRFYCATTRTCISGEVACNGTCLTPGKGQSRWGPFGGSSYPNYCAGLDICYSKNNKTSGKQKCDHFQANCTDDQWLCKDEGCVPLSQPCKNNRASSGRDGCIENYRGKKYSMALCKETNTCLHKFTPCNGSCSASYPRLRYCAATDSCVNIARSCAGSCLLENRFKCAGEDKCVHKNKVNDGKFDCIDKSDENIQDDEDARKAIYKLLKLHNLVRHNKLYLK